MQVAMQHCARVELLFNCCKRYARQLHIARQLQAVPLVTRMNMSGVDRHLQEQGQETVGGGVLEELVGALDASCTKVALQGGTLQSQQADQCTKSPVEEKSIVPVSATRSYIYHVKCSAITHASAL
jgi:hypothetical protein